MSIAAAVGKPLAIDKATQDRTRPSTARVKIIVDLLKKHPKKVTLQILDSVSGNIVELHQQIVFDNLPKFCVFCKHQGHDLTECRIRKQKTGIEEEIEEDLLDNQIRIEVNKIDKLKGDARDFLYKKRAEQRAKELQERKVSKQTAVWNVKVGQCSSAVNVGNFEKVANPNGISSLNPSDANVHDLVQAAVSNVKSDQCCSAVKLGITDNLNQSSQMADMDMLEVTRHLSSKNQKVSTDQLSGHGAKTDLDLANPNEITLLNKSAVLCDKLADFVSESNQQLADEGNSNPRKKPNGSAQQSNMVPDLSAVSESDMVSTGQAIMSYKQNAVLDQTCVITEAPAMNSVLLNNVQNKNHTDHVGTIQKQKQGVIAHQLQNNQNSVINTKDVDKIKASIVVSSSTAVNTYTLAEQLRERDGHQSKATDASAEKFPTLEGVSDRFRKFQDSVTLKLLCKTDFENSVANSTHEKGSVSGVKDVIAQQNSILVNCGDLDAVFDAAKQIQSSKDGDHQMLDKSFAAVDNANLSVQARGRTAHPQPCTETLSDHSCKNNSKTSNQITDAISALIPASNSTGKLTGGKIQVVQSYPPVPFTYVEKKDHAEFSTFNEENKQITLANMRNMVIKSKLWDQRQFANDERWDEDHSDSSSADEDQEADYDSSSEDLESQTNSAMVIWKAETQNTEHLNSGATQKSSLNCNAPVYIPKFKTAADSSIVEIAKIDKEAISDSEQNLLITTHTGQRHSQKDMEETFEEGEEEGILSQCRKDAARKGDLSPMHAKTTKKGRQRDRSFDGRVEVANIRRPPMRMVKQKLFTQRMRNTT